MKPFGTFCRTAQDLWEYHHDKASDDMVNMSIEEEVYFGGYNIDRMCDECDPWVTHD